MTQLPNFLKPGTDNGWHRYRAKPDIPSHAGTLSNPRPGKLSSDNASLRQCKSNGAMVNVAPLQVSYWERLSRSDSQFEPFRAWTATAESAKLSSRV